MARTCLCWSLVSSTIPPGLSIPDKREWKTKFKKEWAQTKKNMFIKIKRLGQTVDFYTDTGGQKNSNETVSCQYWPEVAVATVWRLGDRLSNQTVYSQPANQLHDLWTNRLRCSQVFFFFFFFFQIKKKEKKEKKESLSTFQWLGKLCSSRSPNSGKGYFRSMLAETRFVVVLLAIMVYCVADLGRGLQYSTPLLPNVNRLQLH